MKSINVHFDNEDYKKLKKYKEQSGKGWRDFILQLLPKEEDETHE